SECINQKIRKSAYGRAPAFFGIRKGLRSLLRQGREFRAGLRHVHSRFHSGKKIQRSRPARGCGLIALSNHERRPEFRQETQHLKARRHYANYRVAFAVQPNGAAYDLRIRSEAPRPQLMTENHNMVLS